MDGIDGSYYLKNHDAQRQPSPDLDKDDFLKILMNQLQNQDPLDPMDDKEFTSQMADFSSLEQMMNMGEGMEKIVENQTLTPVIQNSHMIGMEVTYPSEDENVDDPDSESEKMETSQVVAVSEEDGKALLELENGDKTVADNVQQISEPSIGQTNHGERSNKEGPLTEKAQSNEVPTNEGAAKRGIDEGIMSPL